MNRLTFLEKWLKRQSSAIGLRGQQLLAMYFKSTVGLKGGLFIFCETNKNVTEMAMNPDNKTERPMFYMGTLHHHKEKLHWKTSEKVASKFCLQPMQLPVVWTFLRLTFGVSMFSVTGRWVLYPSLWMHGKSWLDRDLCMFLSTKRKKSTKICRTKSRNYF